MLAEAGGSWVRAHRQLFGRHNMPKSAQGLIASSRAGRGPALQVLLVWCSLRRGKSNARRAERCCLLPSSQVDVPASPHQMNIQRHSGDTMSCHLCVHPHTRQTPPLCRCCGRSLLAVSPGLWITTACKQSKNQGRLQRIKRWLTSAGNQRWFYRARSSRACGARIQYPLVYLPSTPSLAPP